MSRINMHERATSGELRMDAAPAMTVVAHGKRSATDASEVDRWIVAIGVRFEIEVAIEVGASGVTVFRFLHRGWLRRFATIEAVEAYLTRATGCGSPAQLKVNRGRESRHTIYRDAQRTFEANGDLEVAAVFAKRLEPRPILPNALDLALARLRKEAR